MALAALRRAANSGERLWAAVSVCASAEVHKSLVVDSGAAVAPWLGACDVSAVGLGFDVVAVALGFDVVAVALGFDVVAVELDRGLGFGVGPAAEGVLVTSAAAWGCGAGAPMTVWANRWSGSGREPVAALATPPTSSTLATAAASTAAARPNGRGAAACAGVLTLAATGAAPA